MAYIIKKLKTFRLEASTVDLLKDTKKYMNQSRFVREAIREKYERDYPKWIEAQNTKQISRSPF